ncbi:MAG: nucleotide exchange factor GrpE [Candidatus Hydrothermarchaeales archaeon]
MEGILIAKKGPPKETRTKGTKIKLAKRRRKEGQLVSLEDEVSKLKESLEEKTKQADEFLSHMQRLQAEFENYKKRAEKEKEDFVKYASEGIILKLLDVYENLERAIENSREYKNDGGLIRGIEMTYKQLKGILENEGLVPIKAVGEKFDPFRHEAVLSEVRADVEENTILEELQRGYTLNNKVIRYSKVKISKEGDTEEKD